jgi:hypothetical protein
MVYQACLARSRRRRTGVFYTPAPVARRLVDLALAGRHSGTVAPGVLDPACGSGVFLLAAAEHLRRAGWGHADCLGAVRGLDVDAGAVAVARLALAWWAWQAAGDGDDGLFTLARRAVQLGDGLAGEAGPVSGGPVDAVVGNPPFLNQLQHDTARAALDRRRLHDRFGTAARGYVDTAALFLLAGLDAVAPGGRVVLVQPESTLVASHATALRGAVAERAVLEGLWLGGAGVFAAGVRVCAPVLRRPATGTVGRVPPPGAVALWSGPTVAPAGRFAVDSTMRHDALAAGSWAPLLAAGRGVPSIAVRPRGTLADLATATAGFRDQFYGLVPYVGEHDGAGTGPDAGWRGAAEGRWRPLVTSGSIGRAGCWWGNRPVRFARRRWSRPVVDVEALAAGDERLHRWVQQRLGPKLLLATQTPVLSAMVDPLGVCVPSVPVIAIEPHGRAAPELWPIAVLLWSSALSVLAAERFAGTGLSAGALRLTARQVLELPLPAGTLAWREAARRCHRATASWGPGPNGDDLGERVRSELDQLVCTAYGLDAARADQAKRWWEQATIRHDPATFL